MKLNSKIKGIFNVASSNIFSFIASMLVSFVLPLLISVEQYGYWQLFILYTSYVGFFAFGFNDGVHLNYATCDYNEDLQSRFKNFLELLLTLTLVETVFIILLIIFLAKTSIIVYDKYIYILSALNILPTIINGMFLYMNQATLRFREYATANIVDKVFFVSSLGVLFIFKAESSYIYMASFTVCRYLVIFYNLYTSKEVLFANSLKFVNLKHEIIKNFQTGLPLMLALIVGGPSLIVGGRFLVKMKFGIDAFSAYSFSIHTLVVAAQFIGAIATVFYPLLKRAEKRNLNRMYYSFDKISTLLSCILLLSYYPALFIVKTIYTSYSAILDYLFLVYPLFIFECKAKVLIVNMYKVNNAPIKLIFVNLIGIIIHLLFISVFYVIWGTVTSIACATLISFAFWYYLIQIHIYLKHGWKIKSSIFHDFISVIIFISINVLCSILIDDFYWSLFTGFLFSLIFIVIGYFLFKNYIVDSIREFKILMD